MLYLNFSAIMLSFALFHTSALSDVNIDEMRQDFDISDAEKNTRLSIVKSAIFTDYQKSLDEAEPPEDFYSELNTRINIHLVRMLILSNEIPSLDADKAMSYPIKNIAGGSQNLGVFEITAEMPVIVKFLGNLTAIFSEAREIYNRDAVRSQIYLQRVNDFIKKYPDLKKFGITISPTLATGTVKIKNVDGRTLSLYWSASPKALGEQANSLAAKYADSNDEQSLKDLVHMLAQKLGLFHSTSVEKISGMSNRFGLNDKLGEIRAYLHGDTQPGNIFVSQENIELIDNDGLGFYSEHKQPVAAEIIWAAKQIEKLLQEKFETRYGKEEGKNRLNNLITDFVKAYCKTLFDGLEVMSTYKTAFVKEMIELTHNPDYNTAAINEIGPYYEKELVPKKSLLVLGHRPEDLIKSPMIK